MDANAQAECSNPNPNAALVNLDFVATVLDSKLEKLKRELTEESSLQLDAAVKRAKTNSKTLKKKGCQRQFDHNEDVRGKIEEATKSIDNGKFQRAKDILSEGIELIDKRQKILKIADSHGWDTVNCYISDDLASDSEDDKRLSKAVREAGYKRREKERQRSKRPTRGRPNFRPFTSATVS
ncbi:uncharacterized protein LOC121427925 [Lytechinus variegatus]|uniref:uncharacterized protein LOC121427925 n=1 Tax=Lytechinus variegatus TaxID=7654 RepID=UPI001BB2C98F|nr:uncharacterized protein LOC121427925 [Lytechinus variegatus]